MSILFWHLWTYLQIKTNAGMPKSHWSIKWPERKRKKRLFLAMKRILLCSLAFSPVGGTTREVSS